MNNEFSNPSLKQALQGMRKEQSHENLLKAAQALLNTKVMLPATWDKAPQTDEHGQLKFDPDTKIALLVVSSENGDKFFPAFTEMEEVKKFFGKTPVTCLILSLDQYLPYVSKAKEEVKGIVVNPKGEDVPFQADFLEGIFKANKQRLNQNVIHKGERVLLKNPPKDVTDLEAALISSGFHEKAINAIYLKERVDDIEHPTKSHWFVVVDSSELDTGIFSRIGVACRKVNHGKEIEFIFTNQKLGRDVAQTSQPIYTKSIH